MLEVRVGPTQWWEAVRSGLQCGRQDSFADTMARVGFYPAAPKAPCVLGYGWLASRHNRRRRRDLVIGQRVMAGLASVGRPNLLRPCRCVADAGQSRLRGRRCVLRNCRQATPG